MLSTIRSEARLSAAVLLAVSAMTLSACNINVRKNEQGDDKKVDIDTPIGGIHVDSRPDAVDTGLAAYPGARMVEEKDGDDQSANVNLSAFGFGLRVAAVNYRSDDPPAKILDFYRRELKKYGDVLECHTSGHPNVSSKSHDSGSKPVTCDEDSGNNIELKVGIQQNQRIVSVEPQGKGTKFALVHVQMRGRDTI